MPFKGISNLDIWPFCSAECNVCAILVEGIMRNNSFKSILNLGQWFRNSCCLKVYSIIHVILLSSNLQTHIVRKYHRQLVE